MLLSRNKTLVFFYPFGSCNGKWFDKGQKRDYIDQHAQNDKHRYYGIMLLQSNVEIQQTLDNKRCKCDTEHKSKNAKRQGRFAQKSQATGSVRASKASLLIQHSSFLIFNFVVSLVSCFIFRHYALEYFHDPLISFYSIFKIFTTEGWFEIPDAIAANATGGMVFFTRLYFIVVLFFGGQFGLSLVNSIFVDSMISDNNDPLEEKIVELDRKIDLLLEQRKT